MFPSIENLQYIKLVWIKIPQNNDNMFKLVGSDSEEHKREVSLYKESVNKKKELEKRL